jgi:F-type H+-transporting ATPase subunit delta
LPAKSATASGIATRYATALFELARERDALDAVAADLAALEGMLDGSGDLDRLIASPVLSREAQGRAVAAVAERAGLGEVVRNFLGLLAQKRRLLALRAIAREFRARLAAHRGETSAEVISAAPLDEAEIARLRESLGRFAGKKVTLATSVDPSLLGGLVVRVGSRMVDASLRTKLRQLEQVMTGVG